MADLFLRFWCFVDEVFYGLVVVLEPVPEGVYFSHSLFYLTAKSTKIFAMFAKQLDYINLAFVLCGFIECDEV